MAIHLATCLPPSMLPCCSFDEQVQNIVALY